MTVKGTIIKIDDTMELGSKNFPVRKFVVETIEKYPQKLELTLLGERVDIVDPYGEGQQVECNIVLQGREVDHADGKRYYNSLVCWSMQTMKHENSPQAM